jgi:polyisoprenoid-binding protein YceI
MKRAIAIVLGLLLLSCPAGAKAPDRYIYDPVHTQVMFSIDHLGFSHTHGKFAKFRGGFLFDEAGPEMSQVEAVIDTASIDMGSDFWNRQMRGKDFFDADKFPEMIFRGTKVEKTAPRKGRVAGELTLLGVTKPLSLDVTYNGSGRNPYNKNYIAGFSVSGVIRRSDFGMTYGLPEIGDEVKLQIEVEGIRQDTGAVNR